MANKLLIAILSAFLGLVLLTSCSAISNMVQGNNIATLGSEGISVSGIPIYSSQYVILVDLKPTKNAIAGQVYTVNLYEKGTLRATTTVSFTQPEINVQSDIMLNFPATTDEYSAYSGQNLNNIFSIKVQAPATNQVPNNTNKQATLTITYPNGGEVFHVGQTITIKWVSKNLSNTTQLYLMLNGADIMSSTSSEITGTIPNTDSYKWTISESLAGRSTIGPKDQLFIYDATNHNIGQLSNFFTITN